MKKFGKLLIGLLGILFLIFVIYIVFFATARPNQISYVEQRSNVIQLEKALNLYAGDHGGLYPPVSSLCTNITKLEIYLVPDYLYVTTFKNPDTYYVSISSNRKNFVLKTILPDGHPFLNEDVDVNSLDCTCEDPSFCITNRENI